MAGAKHTPGPWTIQPYGDGDSLVLHSDGNTRICFMATPGDSPRAFPRIEANARLIAAAPDLLSAAKKVLAGLNERIDAAAQSGGTSVPVFAGIADLSDAINKAEDPA